MHAHKEAHMLEKDSDYCKQEGRNRTYELYLWSYASDITHISLWRSSNIDIDYKFSKWKIYVGSGEIFASSASFYQALVEGSFDFVYVHCCDHIDFVGYCVEEPEVGGSPSSVKN